VPSSRTGVHVYNETSPMVRDGYYYGLALIAAAVLLGWLTQPAWAIIPVLLALFFLWFFRDPERTIPVEPGAVVSPADGKVTDVSVIDVRQDKQLRLSIFLNVFNVHVNRTPISGVIREIRYQRGKFMNAMGAASAEENEQNIVTVEGGGQRVVFKQIAGLLARRIVFNPKVGDHVERGQRIGLIKFGSRCDVLIDASARPNVKLGDLVKGGSSVLAYLPTQERLTSDMSVAAEKVR
jgi:phosphatidylserine decarboxylase